MTFKRKLLGQKGEDAAARRLEKSGFRILCRNYRCGLGEIDLVAQDGDFLVFVEVRSHSSEAFGLAQESVNSKKQHKLRQLAWYYLKAEGKTEKPCRFDVVAVLFDASGQVKKMEHIKNAF